MGEKHIVPIEPISEISKNTLANFSRQLADLQAKANKVLQTTKSADSNLDLQSADTKSSLDKTQLTKLVEKLNQQLQTDNITARLKVDTDSGKIYIQIINKKTKAVLEEIPSQEVSGETDNIIDKKG
ncbi:flagellar protein FlaG [Liquorilactobacillus vini]|uniref:Flagellar protein FlaG n=1 Tax=Liquorilactobacillus vini DSM 20605 TaxID=1133569 RepID=A0A0A7RGT0_9LACO|nr:flagellar protein FlaG [Liquorilactobacillus vini]AJA34467.1 flagellar protein FlaG [Liquorilactobacillus vini DSM 20605]KRM88612.1 hypothetical protein FD21_GL000985 [Liquorilactobacillus vini DSM 20605]